MADQTIATVAAPQAAQAPVATKETAKATAPVKAEPPKAEASGNVGQSTPNPGVGTKVNYYA